MIVVVAVVALVLSACAPGENPAATLGDGGAGFWLGLWHGIILPITFIISLFNDNVGVYEVFNSGGWYNFGFVLGAGTFLGGSSRAGRRKR